MKDTRIDQAASVAVSLNRTPNPLHKPRRETLMTQLKRLASCDIDNPVTCRPETSNRRRRWWYAGALGRLLAMLAAACTLIAPVSAIAQTCDGMLTWTGIAPDCLAGGASYRILFVTAGVRDASSSNINTYNTFVQGQANDANGDPFDGITFRALGSTASTDARDNTMTTGTGEQIFYYRGNKVADNYADLYDGSWDTNSPRDQNGASSFANSVWTGTTSAGVGASGNTLGLFLRSSSPSNRRWRWRYT